MNWINRAEAKFGHLAIPFLPELIVTLNLAVYCLWVFNPKTLGLLTLDMPAVMHGQVWRLFTFLTIPQISNWLGGSWLWFVLYLLFILFIARGLQQALGAFQFNLYYFIGAASQILAAFIVPNAGDFGNASLNLTLLFAFERFFPDLVIYIMFILPAKIKWIVWFAAAMTLLSFVAGGWDFRVSILASFINYLLFFGADIAHSIKHRREVTARRQRFEQDSREARPAAMHECAVCGRTELTSPDLDFRVSRDGNEYCLEHLPKPTST